MKAPHVLALMAFVSFVAPAHGQRICAIDDLFKKFDRMNSPGAVAVVVQDGQIIHLNGYGNANMEYAIPITAKTIFHVGSVAKQFTALAILLLEERGKLSLEDVIGNYLSDLPALGNQIKIRHLLHHTSGLREIEKLQRIAGITSADHIESTGLYNLVKNQKELNFKPGDEFEYSNTNYFLLSRIVEIISAQSFSAWTKKNIFDPLKMPDTQFYDDCSVIVKNRAAAYGDWEGALVKGILSYSYTGPTSVMTNGEDMAKWLANFSEMKVGGRATIRKMLEMTGTLNSGERLEYGCGLGITKFRGQRVVVHSGMDANFRACVIYFPDHRLGISILSNYFSVNPLHHGYEIANILLTDRLRDRLKRKDRCKDEAEPQEPEGFVLPMDKLLAYEGVYYSEELAVLYRIRVQNEALHAIFWRNPDVRLTPIKADCFKGNQYWLKQIAFLRDNRGNITGFRLESGNVRKLTFRKLPEKR